jgi:hypothetical protein
VRRNAALRRAGGRGLDHVAKRFVGRDASKSSGSPLAQVVLRAAFERLAKHQPRLPHRARHHADIREFDVCMLGTVTAAHRHDQPHDFAAPLEPGTRKRA